MLCMAMSSAYFPLALSAHNTPLLADLRQGLQWQLLSVAANVRDDVQDCGQGQDKYAFMSWLTEV